MGKKNKIWEFIAKQEMAEMLGVHENTITAMCEDGRLITDRRGRLPGSENVVFLTAKAPFGKNIDHGLLTQLREDVIGRHVGQIERSNEMLDEILKIIRAELRAEKSSALCAKLDDAFREPIPHYSSQSSRIHR